MPSIIANREPTKKPDTVRMARPGDEKKIFDLLLLLHDENAIFPRDDNEVMETIVRGTRNENGMIGVIESKGEIVGAVGLFIEKYWYTKVWHLSEYWNFVHPDYRCREKTGNHAYAHDLIDFSKWANENMGLILSMGIISTHRTEAKVRLYGRKLIPVGAFFMNGLSENREA